MLTRKIYKIVDIEEELLPNAQSEDRWESLVQDQMKEEGLQVPWADDGPTTTYAWSYQVSRLWLEWQIEKIWQDWIARGEALHKIVEEERKLAEQERGDAAKSQDDVGSTPESWNAPRTGPRPHADIVETRWSFLPDPILQMMKTDETLNTKDPFSSKTWAAIVDYDERKRQRRTRDSSAKSATSGRDDVEDSRPSYETLFANIVGARKTM